MKVKYLADTTEQRMQLRDLTLLLYSGKMRKRVFISKSFLPRYLPQNHI